MLKKLLAIFLCILLFVSTIFTLSACKEGDDPKDSETVGDLKNKPSLEGTNSKTENEYDKDDSGKIEF